MKRQQQSFRRFLDQSFARLFKVPPSPVESAWERVLERLREEPEEASKNAQVALDSVLPIRPTVMSRQLWAVAAAAVVVLAVTLSVAFFTASAPAVVENTEGGLQKLEIGDVIQMGEIIRSNGRSGGTLKLADGSRVEMRSSSELSLEPASDGVRIHLRSGGIIVNAAKQRVGHLYVQTKDMTVSVVGTVFLVNAEEAGSRVAVIEGEVHVRQNGIPETKLGPGEQVTTSSKMETIPVKEEVAWSREAVAHLALLQQSAPALSESRDAFDVVSIRRRPEASSNGGARGAAGQQDAGAGGGGPCEGRLQLDPSRFAATGAGVYFLVALAYGLDEGPFPCGVGTKAGVLSGGPDWIQSANFDIEAAMPEGPSVLITEEGVRRGRTPLPIVTKKPGPRLRNMVRTMLEDRFKLKLKRTGKEMPVYVLSVATGGPKVASYKEGDWVGEYRSVAGYDGIKNGFAPPKPYGDMLVGAIGAGRSTMAQLGAQLSYMTGRPVLDRTSLPGHFSYEFFFAPADYGKNTGHDLNMPDDPRPHLTSPSLFKVLEDELGLKLEERREKVEVFVVESVERPSEN